MRKRIQYKKVLKAHQDRIYGYALYFLRNRDDASDVAQETFIRLWNHWQTIDLENVSAWLMRVNHHLCIDYVRKRKLNTKRFTSIHDDPFWDVGDDVNSGYNPEYAYQFTELQKILLTALDALPEQTKSIMIMHYVQGIKLTDISEMMAMNLNTVKVTALRGRKQLKELMEKHYPEVTEAFL